MDMGGMDMGGGGRKSYTHMTFFWGKNSEILFTGWPGARGGMYALALVVVFLLCFLVEWLSHCRVVPARWSRPVAALARTVMHTIRVGLAYIIMLALMSFNGGVLLVAVAGHALGFLLFGSSAIKDPAESTPADLPPMKC